MKKFCILASILFLASCLEVTIPNRFYCELMILSDALPVQFWPAGCDTYNETVPKGVHEKCICLPWQCDDEINIQFKEDPTSPETDYSLVAIDSDNEILGSSAFSEIESGTYQTSLIPSNYGICDEDISLVIVDRAIDEILSNPDFDTSLSPWVNVAGSDEDWSWSFGSAIVTLLDSNVASDKLRQDFTEQPAGLYTVVAVVSNTDNAGSISFNVRVYSGITEVAHIISTTFDSLSDLTLTFSDINIPDSFDRIEITVVNPSVSSSQVVSVHSVSFNLQVLANPELYPRTDCLNIATIQDETELIEYSNNRNTFGITYADVSPDQSFNIRVPCRFFHEVFPEEDEAIELTSSIITTSGQLKSQKLLEVKHVPYYFHKKLQLILKHQNVSINDHLYQKEEKYEINPGSKQWPLKSATCLLTEKNSVLRNVL